ncbi:MAG: carboxypeptidase regulatory-like domain-containing protein [Gemmatimonadaceae bacterium]|nr:carboxypeptidase regulatory-like domain-containing protein [Gemmatimonadaceae bacterium]
MGMYSPIALYFGACVLFVPLGRTLAAQPPERQTGAPLGVARDTVTVQGTVRGANGVVVARAAVLLTRPSDMRTQTRMSDSLGRFVFREERGTGEFLLAVRAASFRPIGRRIVVEPGQRLLDQPVVLTLLHDATALDVVRVTAKREVPPPSTYATLGVRPGSLEGLSDGARAGQSIVAVGPADLTRTSLLGTPDAEGLSVAGLSGRESQTDLNGLLFRGGVVPASLPKRVQVSAGTYDIASAGYSGGAISLDVPPAGEFRTVSADVITSTGGSAARGTAAAQSRPFVAVDWGGDWRTRSGAGGATFGMRVSRRDYETATLQTTGDSALRDLGVDPQVARSASAFMQRTLLANRHAAMPVQAGHSATALIRIDPKIQTDAVNAFTLGATYATQPRGGWAPLSVLPGTWRDSHSEFLAQWQRSAATPAGARWETRAGLTASNATSTPTTSGLADVRVTTVATPGASSFGAPIRLGGNAGSSERQRMLGELQMQRTAFVGAKGSHAVKLIAAGRIDHLKTTQPEYLTTSRFESLEALESLAPQGLEVTRQPPTLGATVVRASTGIGDDWRIGVGKRLQYGLRGDVTWLDDAHERGRNSSFIATLSPRVGFSWTLRPPNMGEGFSTSTLFSRHLLAAGVLRVGAGVFHRDLTPDELLGSARYDRSAVQRCLDPGPIEAQELLLPAAVDAVCSDTPQAVSELSTSQINQHYAPPRSVRATASYTGNWHNIDIQSSAVWNHTAQQSQTVDRTVRSMPLSTLASEGQRPFYVPMTAINPETGVIDRSMTSSLTGVRQYEIESSLATRTLQGMVQVSPRWNDGGRALRLGYVWTRSLTLGSSWNTPAFGPVGLRNWLPNGRTPTHTVQLESGKAFRMLNLTGWVRAQSGQPYAPTVQGDVNGDGVAGNDAAWIPANAASSSDLAQALSAFAENASPRAKRCLELAKASVGSSLPCRTPWTFQSALSAFVDLRDFGWRTDAAVTLQLENVAALAGAMAGIPLDRGWGQPNAVNRTLLRPTGFDSTAGRFAYAINQAFARRLGAASDGYRITLSARIALSPPIQRQQVSRWLAARGVGSRLPADTIAQRFARNVPVLYDAILELTDELGLRSDQMSALAARRVGFDQRLQRRWDEMAQALTALPRNFDVDTATSIVQRATDDAWEINRLEAHAIRDLFTPIQHALLPGPVRLLMQAQTPIKQRIVFH